jgi:hypothetical protein
MALERSARQSVPNNNLFRFPRKKTDRHFREWTMARTDFGSLPRENPCAQCGEPIGVPEWIESEASRTRYLWHCLACDYRFEAVAIFEDADQDALAA